MRKQFLIILAIAAFASGCGQKSTIKNDVKAQRLADAYGDGKHVIRSLTFPLTDSSMAFESPLPGIGPIAGGLLKFMGDMFAKNTNMGKLQMSYIQPLPEIPSEILNSVRLKRIFFYMKPVQTKRRFRDWIDRTIMGKGDITFKFLDKLAVRMTSVQLDGTEEDIEEFKTEDYDKKKYKTLMETFKKKYTSLKGVIDTENAKELVLLKYHGKNKQHYIDNEKYGRIHILETSHPAKTKHFLMSLENMKGLYKRILILDDSLLIELEKDPVANETFNEVISDRANEMENLGVTYIDECSPDSCLELNVPDVNLIPIAAKGNGLKLEAVLHAGRVPESFRLKGFVEFEVKIDSPI